MDPQRIVAPTLLASGRAYFLFPVSPSPIQHCLRGEDGQIPAADL